MSGHQYPTFDLDILQGKKGDSEAQDREWLRVFRHYNPRLESFFSWRCADQDELEELGGEIWSRAFLFASSLTSSAALWSWLTTIGNNVMRDWQRRQRRGPFLIRSELEKNDILGSLIEGWHPQASTEAVVGPPNAELLQQLSPDEREFLELFAVDGLTHEEIAVRLGLPNAVASRQRLRRLRLKILKNLESSNKD